MWKKPAWITDIVAAAIWNTLAGQNEVPRFKYIGVDDTVADKVFGWLNTLADIANRHLGRYTHPTAMNVPDGFRTEFGRWLAREAQTYEDARHYENLHRLSKIGSSVYDMASNQPGGRKMAECGMYLITAFHALLGSERKILVGARDGIPVWQKVRTIHDRESAQVYLSSAFKITNSIGIVTPDELWMLPEIDGWDETVLNELVETTEYTAINSELIENAFNNEQYLVDPLGVEVKVTNARSIEKIVLKVRATTDHFVEIMARIETSSGAFFMAIDEAKMMKPSGTYMGSYPAYVVCQIYHDLVVSAGVRIAGSTDSDTAPPGLPSSPNAAKPGYIVIPRLHQVGSNAIRTKLAVPKAGVPQRVTGHLRHTPMTLEHRAVLLEYERTWKVEILRFVPDGYTFVRPHMSPQISPEDFAALPRFIRYRVQQALNEALKAPIKLKFDATA